MQGGGRGEKGREGRGSEVGEQGQVSRDRCGKEREGGEVRGRARGAETAFRGARTEGGSGWGHSINTARPGRAATTATTTVPARLQHPRHVGSRTPPPSQAGTEQP